MVQPEKTLYFSLFQPSLFYCSGKGGGGWVQWGGGNRPRPTPKATAKPQPQGQTAEAKRVNARAKRARARQRKTRDAAAGAQLIRQTDIIDEKGSMEEQLLKSALGRKRAACSEDFFHIYAYGGAHVHMSCAYVDDLHVT